MDLTDDLSEVDAEAWIRRIRRALTERPRHALRVAEQGLEAWPEVPEVLLLTALAAVAAERTERALGLVRRFQRLYRPHKTCTVIHALAVAQSGKPGRARALLSADGMVGFPAVAEFFVGPRAMLDWLRQRLRELDPPPSPARPKPPRQTAQPDRAPPAPDIPDLPRREVALAVHLEMPHRDAILSDGDAGDLGWFRLRGALTRLSLFEGFDDLLCLPALAGVDAHWHQTETVRKVLKQFRGRVLLADEVGLGKTIEAGMVVKEYVLRGMAERILILTPAALVGQWRDEMAEKFGIAFATSHDPLLRADPEAFWAQPLVIASIAAARRKDHADRLAALSYDVVVVDEAHHLRDQASASYRLVDRLAKRFLLLLSATPVQNSLLELYNLLTLLKPGVFKTAKEFRTAYMVTGKPREPANRDRLRELMRGVMVRNTRALAALRLPRRHASTLRAVPGEAEAACYAALSALVREGAGGNAQRLAAQHLLSAGGSSPAAASGAIGRFMARHPGETRWKALLERYRAVGAGAKQEALLKLLAQNPAEKKMVFVHHRDSLAHLAELLTARGSAFARFEGGMSGPEKDAAVAAFGADIPLLLCSESGGEGRNLQFCNTLINYDIPWNPMAIEQRIGRIDRIGQTREVFVFNLVTTGTIEDAVLRILDEKINMFELVVGEVGAILGEFDEEHDFPTLVLDAWLRETEATRAEAFTALEQQLLAARRQYDGAKALDDALFGNELDVA